MLWDMWQVLTNQGALSHRYQTRKNYARLAPLAMGAKYYYSKGSIQYMVNSSTYTKVGDYFCLYSKGKGVAT